MTDRIVILGSGDHARVVYDALDRAGRAPEVLCFVNFASEEDGVKYGWMGVTTYLSWATFLKEVDGAFHSFVVALGDIGKRKRTFELALEAGLQPTTVVHPSSIISIGAYVGAGSMVSANCLIGVDARIGENCIVNSGAIVDHDCVVGSHSTIAPAATLAGRVTIEEMVMVGMGACVLDEVCIGSRSTVAAGAVVTGDVPSGVMIAGVPAIIKKKINTRA
ncbi:acetyltransferase [Microvirgula aerodenitrificans]|uniref:acetyltransferase n=1 Tax=Microvirgula aerodenitrificans TaxID=57480 RepID=UPI00248F2BDD|nr:acetyltransferase [Microvirgula aerodenitrificans]